MEDVAISAEASAWSQPKLTLLVPALGTMGPLAKPYSTVLPAELLTYAVVPLEENRAL